MNYAEQTVSESREIRSARRISAAILIAYGIAVAFVVFWPTPVDGPSRSQIKLELIRLHKLALLPRWFGYDQLEFSSNVLLFVPLGVLLSLLLGLRSWWISIPIVFASSAAIEVTQGLFLPERVASISDVIANGTGGTIGAISVFLIARNVSSINSE